MKETLTYIVKSLVENPDKVIVTEETTEMGTTYYIEVGEGDMGRIIGKQGKTISSLRTIFKAAGLKQKKNIRIELIEKDKPQAPAATQPEEITAPAEEPTESVVTETATDPDSLTIS